MHAFTGLCALFLASVLNAPALADDQPSRQTDIEVAAADGVTLAGSLVLPEGRVRATLVFIAGSGTHVRDQVISGTPIFQRLAMQLSERGIATVRFDERGAGETPGPAVSSFFDQVSDVQAQLAFVTTLEALDGAPVCLLGHSEGALIAIRAAVPDDAVRCLVLLGAPARPGDAVWVDQQVALTLPPEATSSERIALQGALEAVTARVLDEDATGLNAAVRNLFEVWGAPQEAFTDGSVDMFAQRMAGSQMSAFLAYDPADDLSKIDQPILAIYGAADLQTRPAFNIPALLDAEPSGAGTSVSVLAGEDHFLLHLPGEAPNVHRYGEMELAPQLAPTVSEWVLDVVANTPLLAD